MQATLQGLEANRRSGSAEMRAYGLRLAARIHQIQGNKIEAASYLEKAVQTSSTHELSPLTLSLNAAIQVEMAITEGNLRQAELASTHVTNSLGVYPFIFYPEIARAHLLLLQGKPAQALGLLEPVLALAAQPGWEYPRLQFRVLQALAASEPARAQTFLQEALSLAQPGAAVRTFIDLGEPMRCLIRDTLAHLDNLTLKAYAQWLLALFPVLAHEQHADLHAAISDELVEPLSEREIEVLRLIAEGLSNTEIAQKLYLSTNTLKAHTQNIYSKLDVHSRVQAVNRARELNIL
jgi:LuxR family transcriptional regulator, maltose regulon positive regulatory protein